MINKCKQCLKKEQQDTLSSSTHAFEIKQHTSYTSGKIQVVRYEHKVKEIKKASTSYELRKAWHPCMHYYCVEFKQLC